MKIVNVILGVVGILIALAVWWSNHAKGNANELIKEGNAKYAEGSTLETQAHEKLQAVHAANFPEQAVEIRKLANEGAELFGKSSGSFRDAAVKYQSAAETVLESHLKEYYSLEQKSAAKLAELQAHHRKYLLIYADPSIQDVATLNKKTLELEEQSTKIKNEYLELAAAAKKFVEEHKSELIDLK